MKRIELDHHYGFGPITDQQCADMDMVRGMFLDLARCIYDEVPDNRARDVALTNLQQAKLWVIQSIADQ